MTSLIIAVFKCHYDTLPSIGESDYRPLLLADRQHKITASDHHLRCLCRKRHLKSLAWSVQLADIKDVLADV